MQSGYTSCLNDDSVFTAQAVDEDETVTEELVLSHLCLSVCGRTFKLVSLSLNTDVFIWLYYAWTVKPNKYTQDIQWLEGCKCFGIEMQAGQAWALYRKSKVLFPGGAQDGETVLYKVELKSWFFKYDFCTLTKCIKRKCNHFFLPDSFCCCFLCFSCVCVCTVK